MQEMFANLSQMGALVILLGIMFFGEFAAKVSGGKIPSALVVSILMLGGFWTVLPADIVARAGISPLVYILSAMLLVTNLGTLISRKEMIAQWRTVVICLMGIAAICAITLGVSSRIFGWQEAVSATPPLTGGAIATLMMSEAATAAGNQKAQLIALLTMTVQGLAGYPLTSIFLGKEAKRLNALYKEGALQNEAADADAATKNESFFTKNKSATYILLKLAVIALASHWMEILITTVTGGGLTISKFVWCLVFGFFATEFKFLEKDALAASNSSGLATSFLMIYLYGSLSSSTFELVKAVIVPVFFMVVFAATAMAIMAFVASKVFSKNINFNMAYPIILTAFYGFPVNMILTNEAVAAATDDQEAQVAIRGQILPKMLVGGFTSVTIVSVLVAGVLVGWL